MVQDESEYAPQCTDRANNGYNSGMGEIFRRVASISPVRIKDAEGNVVIADTGKVPFSITALLPPHDNQMR
jgi:hypothetical protein